MTMLRMSSAPDTWLCARKNCSLPGRAITRNDRQWAQVVLTVSSSTTDGAPHCGQER
jgi:hypothetical protein